MDTNFTDRCHEIINDAIKKGSHHTEITHQNNPFMSSLHTVQISHIYKQLELWYWNQHTEPIGISFGGTDSGSSVWIHYVSRPKDIFQAIVQDNGSTMGYSFDQADSEAYETNKQICYANCLRAILISKRHWGGPLSKVPDFKLEQNTEFMIGYAWDYLYYDVQKMVGEQTQWILQKESHGWSLTKK